MQPCTMHPVSTCFFGIGQAVVLVCSTRDASMHNNHAPRIMRTCSMRHVTTRLMLTSFLCHWPSITRDATMHHAPRTPQPCNMNMQHATCSHVSCATHHAAMNTPHAPHYPCSHVHIPCAIHHAPHAMRYAPRRTTWGCRYRRRHTSSSALRRATLRSMSLCWRQRWPALHSGTRRPCTGAGAASLPTSAGGFVWAM